MLLLWYNKEMNIRSIVTAILLISMSCLMPEVRAARPAGEKKTFTITGYYSPLPGQEFYVTGDYYSEIRLNGSGIAGADGTGVYPGMIAAPSSYTFGTKVCIPSLGCGKIHDRGGAIVEKGKRSLARHDRLDIWMGYGEEGLRRALAWGVQHLECEVYEEDTPIAVSMNFEVPPMLHQILELPQKRIFARNLSSGSRNGSVRELQEILRQLGFFEGELTGTFGSQTKEAVFAFQKKHFLLENETDYGAGIFGPQTREKLSTVLYHAEIEQKIREAWENFHFDEDLRRGNRNQAVLKLQEILVQHEFMNVSPTGYFGPKTQAALEEFQIHYKIIAHKNALGAGKVGPSTREILNQLLLAKKDIFSQEQKQILAAEKQRNRLQYFAGQIDQLNNKFVQK